MTLAIAAAALFASIQASPDSLSAAAQKLAMEKRYDEAAGVWRRALAAAPNHFQSLFNLGFMFYTLERYGEAEPFLARAARVRPSDFNTRYILGSTLVHLGKREAGLLSWRAALAVQPKNHKLMQIMSVEYDNGYYYREACEIARRALALSKDSAETFFIAIKACHDAQDPAAFDLAHEAAKRFPASARANFEHGYQLQRAGRAEESLPYLKKAMEADPSYEEPFFFYGNLLLVDDRFEEAAANLRTALRNRPDYVAACVSLARALMGMEKYREAVEELDGCSLRSPTHPQPHFLLSQVYFRMGDEQRAQSEKNLSLRLRRENPAIMESPQTRPFPVPKAPPSPRRPVQ